MPGIKETTEMVIGVNETSLVVIPLMKDGVQFKDFEDFYKHLITDPEYKAKMKDAYDKCREIPAEIEDLSWAEAFSLGKIQLDYVPKIIEAIKKPQKPVNPIEG
jgi:hypothetical protein